MRHSIPALVLLSILDDLQMAFFICDTKVNYHLVIINDLKNLCSVNGVPLNVHGFAYTK